MVSLRTRFAAVRDRGLQGEAGGARLCRPRERTRLLAVCQLRTRGRACERFSFPVRGRTRKDIVMWRNESMVRMCAKYGVSGIAEAMQLPQSQLIDFLETFMNEQDALLAKPAGAPLVSGACTCSSSASVDCADGHGGRRRVCSDCGKVKGL